MCEEGGLKRWMVSQALRLCLFFLLPESILSAHIALSHFSMILGIPLAKGGEADDQVLAGFFSSLSPSRLCLLWPRDSGDCSHLVDASALNQSLCGGREGCERKLWDGIVMIFICFVVGFFSPPSSKYFWEERDDLVGGSGRNPLGIQYRERDIFIDKFIIGVY